VCSALLGMVFCLDFDPFLFLLLLGVYLVIYNNLLGAWVILRSN
jgi:hypothetical protein